MNNWWDHKTPIDKLRDAIYSVVNFIVVIVSLLLCIGIPVGIFVLIIAAIRRLW